MAPPIRNTLLKDTFTGKHTVTSGDIDLTLTIDPSGSSLLSGPITFTFGGPFQSRGAGKLPESNFTVSASALGHNVRRRRDLDRDRRLRDVPGLELPVAGGELPEARIELRQLSTSPGTSSGSSALTKLGIHPLNWLTNPTVVGTENVGGAQTDAHPRRRERRRDAERSEHRARRSPPRSESRARPRRRSPSGIPAADRSKIAAEVKNPSVDIWTGTSDKTIRRLTITLTVPVTGKTSTQLGGVTSADIGLTLQYSDLNQPQTINAPTTVKPFSQFQAKLQLVRPVAHGRCVAAGGRQQRRRHQWRHDEPRDRAGRRASAVQPVHPEGGHATSRRSRSAPRC